MIRAMPPHQHSRDTDNGFAGVPLTFARVPMAVTPADLEGVDVAVLGAPFDLAVTYRPGTRFGPRAVRQAEDVGVGGRPSIELGIDPYEALKVVDYGDAAAPPSDVLGAHEAIQTLVAEILTAGAIPAVIGGDHSITLPVLRALAAYHGANDYSVIHFDTQRTRRDPPDDPIPNHGGAVLARGRGGRPARRQRWCRSACARLLAVPGGLRPYARAGLPLAHDGRDRRPRAEGGARRRDRPGGANGARTYLTVDVDSIKTAFAPGTGTPEPGGLTSRELLRGAPDRLRGRAVRRRPRRGLAALRRGGHHGAGRPARDPGGARRDRAAAQRQAGATRAALRPPRPGLATGPA